MLAFVFFRWVSAAALASGVIIFWPVRRGGPLSVLSFWRPQLAKVTPKRPKGIQCEPKCFQKPARRPPKIDEKSTLWPQGVPGLSREVSGYPPGSKSVVKIKCFIKLRKNS